MENKQKKSGISRCFQKLCRQKITIAALLVIVLLVLISLFGYWIVPYDPIQPDYGAVLQGPTSQHLLGTDEFGRDVFSRLLAGTRISLGVSVSSVLLGAVIGSFLGLMSGYYGGVLDGFIMRSCDILFAFPGILLAIGIIAILGPGLKNVVIAVTVYTIPVFTRIIRSSTLGLKNMMYIEAARSMGIPNRQIIRKHIFPGTFPVMLVYITMRIGSGILIAASLSYIGLGAQPPLPEWGAMLTSGREYLVTAPHVAFFPGFAILITCLAFNLFGDGLRDALDQKITE